MKSIKTLAFILLTMFATTVGAASEQELFHAAKEGDIAGIQAALRAGADINARFDVGKTALMVAAENGQDAAVELLVKSGADLYLLDNNHWDALTHAAFKAPKASFKSSFSKQPSPTFSLLLQKGFDPSKNNWRALTVLAGQSAGAAHLVAAQTVLEKMRKSGITGQSAEPGTAARAPQDNQPWMVMAKPTVIEIDAKKVTPEIFKTAANKTLSGHGWKVMASEPKDVTGTLTKDKLEYRVRISLISPTQIKLGYVEYYGSDNAKWLATLKKDMEKALSKATGR